MPKLTHRVPKYRRHKASGQAIVTLSGRDFYLGRWRSKKSKVEYNRLVSEYLARDREPPAPGLDELTIVDLIARYWRHVKEHYRKGRNQTSEVQVIRDALRPLRELYSHTLARDFGPVALEAVRQRFVENDLVRGTINAQVCRVRRMFKWAVAKQLLPETIHRALCCLDGLKKGRSDVRESKGIKPVPDQTVQATLPHLNATLGDMVKFQRLTGCRPGEVCILRPCDVDRSLSTWVYRPESHKTQHHGRERLIFIGPKAQAVLAPYLLRESETFCFSPREQQKRRWPNRGRKKRFRHLNVHYSVDSLRRGIHRACDAAGVERWNPNQLRHTAGTEIRRKFGIEGCQVALGHADAFVTQVYAERDWKLAERIAKEIG